MKTNQPSWHCIANLGDVNPLDHGGNFVLVDKRGIYSPELWIYKPKEEEGKGGSLCTVTLDLCTPCEGNPGNVSDNRFHNDCPAWFGDSESIKDVSSFAGKSEWQFSDELCSSCPIERAEAYLMLYHYYGGENFGGFTELTQGEAGKLCRKLLSQERASSNWKDGI